MTTHELLAVPAAHAVLDRIDIGAIVVALLIGRRERHPADSSDRDLLESQQVQRPVVRSEYQVLLADQNPGHLRTAESIDGCRDESRRCRWLKHTATIGVPCGCPKVEVGTVRCGER